MKNPLILIFLIIFSFANSFGQSKKEQIELLNHRVDSLNRILSSERTTIKQQKALLEQQIVNLNSSITNLNAQATRDNSLIKSKELEFSKVSSALSSLTSLLKVKSDSLNLVLGKLVKLTPPIKVAPVIPVVDNKGPVKGVAIGTQTWTTKNLDIIKFRNGDPIPEAKTNEEWREAGRNGEPAWCHFNNNTANGTKYGKLYNWYAINDYRGLAPAGFHIPTDEEWTILSDFLGGESVAGKKLKSTSAWLQNGNGTNSSMFSGLPGGYRNNDGTFGDLGYYGTWWRSREKETYMAWSFGLNYATGVAFRGYANKSKGFSVRCVKD